MGIAGTCIIYGVIGLVVAAAMALREIRPSIGWRPTAFLTWAIFWPLFAPALLSAASEASHSAKDAPDIDPRFRGAEERLLTALSKLGAVSGSVLTPEIERVRALTASLVTMSRRQGELDKLLESPECDTVNGQATLEQLAARGVGDDDARIQSVRTRMTNIERLRILRDHTQENLERAILKMEEMSSQVLLLRFAESSEAEVVELIREIAENVAGISEGLITVA
jgi:hypothetical protein